MTSQRWSTLVSGLLFALVLTTGDSARAQWGFSGTSGFASAGQFGLGYGAVPGISPIGYSPWGAGDWFGTSNFIGFPQPGYAESIEKLTAYDHVVSIGLRNRVLGPRLERFAAPDSPPKPSTTKSSSRGNSSVIAVG